MRASDVVDLLSELLPPWLKQVLISILLAAMVFAGTTQPVVWYVTDKAAWMSEQLGPVLEQMIETATQPVHRSE